MVNTKDLTVKDMLIELFDIAWDLNQKDNTRCELSQKVTTYLPCVIQDFDYMVNKLKEV